MTINVKPIAENRREFARWAVGHRIRTESQNSFAVPEHLFASIPEHLLAGAHVDGQSYHGVSLPSPTSGASNEVQTIEPEPKAPEMYTGDDPAEAVKGTVFEVNTWIGDDQERARAILATGEERKGVLNYVSELDLPADDQAEPGEDDESPPENDQGTVVPF